MILQKLKAAIQFIANPRLILCFGIGWMITNGWAYLMLALGSYFEIAWIVAIAGAYLTFIWFPFTLEKLVTCAIAIILMRRWFPQDVKTLGVLRTLRQKTIDLAKRKKKRSINNDNQSRNIENCDDAISH